MTQITDDLEPIDDESYDRAVFDTDQLETYAPEDSDLFDPADLEPYDDAAALAYEANLLKSLRK